MTNVTHLLEALGSGDGQAAARLLPLVYDELRRLAAARLAGEALDNTLEPTALVHEAYLRLVDQNFDGRGHFFAAAAEAMRRILVESARRKNTTKRGGQVRRQPLLDELALHRPTDELLAVHDAVDALAIAAPRAAELVKLRYFAGFTLEQAAELLDISPRTADGLWAYSRAWLRVHLTQEP